MGCSLEYTTTSGRYTDGHTLALTDVRACAHIVGGKRDLEAGFGGRGRAFGDVVRALGTGVDRQQLAAAPQDAAQDRLAGGGIGGVDLVQPLLGRGVDAMEAIVAADREQFELAARADATISAHPPLGCAGCVALLRGDARGRGK